MVLITIDNMMSGVAAAATGRLRVGVAVALCGQGGPWLALVCEVWRSTMLFGHCLAPWFEGGESFAHFTHVSRSKGDSADDGPARPFMRQQSHGLPMPLHTCDPLL